MRILGFIALLASLALAALFFLAPRFLRPKLESAGNSACSSCHLEIGSMSFRLFPLGAVFRDVHFQQGDPRDSAVFATAAVVQVPVLSFSRSPVRLGRLRLEGVAVTVQEGDAHFPPEKGRKEEGAGFEVEGIYISGGVFTYRKDSPAGAAFLHLSGISAVGGKFGSSVALREQSLHARATALLEHSGAIDLTVNAKFFSANVFADVDLKLEGQKLQEVNEYFQPEDGVSIEGALQSAHGLVSVRDRRAEGQVHARFSGFGLHFRSNRNRSGLTALLENLGVQLKVKGANLNVEPGKASKAVVTARHAKESVVSFILRSMLQAAIRVASSG